MILTSNSETAALRVRARARHVYPDLQLPDSASLPVMLASLPILSKSDLGRHLPPKCEWLKSAVLFSETSGTTGQPLFTPRGGLDLIWNAANQGIAYKRFLQPGVDRVAILHPSILSPFIEASSIALRQLNIGQLRVFPIPNVCDYRRIFDVLNRYEITSIMSTPSLTYKLLYEFRESDIGCLPPSLRNLLLTGENLSQPSINNFKRIIGGDCLVTPFVYGSSEAATLMLGRKDGLFDPLLDDFIFELNPSNAMDGANKLIVTWLRDGLMPILRYDTGDYFAIQTEGENSALRFLGRDEISDANYEFMFDIERIAYSLSCAVYHYECSVDFNNKILQLIIIVEKDNGKIIHEITDNFQAFFPDWKISVAINPVEASFMQFSPSPKTKRFVKC